MYEAFSYTTILEANRHGNEENIITSDTELLPGLYPMLSGSNGFMISDAMSGDDYYPYDQNGKIAIIGKEGLYTKGKNVAQDLWQQANSDFREIADLGMKNADGSFVGFWGAMSDEMLSFLPWTDDFSRGLYLAGVEVYEDTAAPHGWVKWVMPARKYLVTKVTPESYRETFDSVIHSLIPKPGMKPAGAVCDFTEPATGQNKLFFSVE